eukprot:Skav215344  [mRNA]  locus=scaffold1391:374842:376535:- [translate_table: standard]
MTPQKDKASNTETQEVHPSSEPPALSFAEERDRRIQELKLKIQQAQEKKMADKAMAEAKEAAAANPDQMPTLAMDLSPIAKTFYGVPPAPIDKSQNMVVDDHQLEGEKPEESQNKPAASIERSGTDESLLKAPTRRLDSFAVPQADQDQPQADQDQPQADQDQQQAEQGQPVIDSQVDQAPFWTFATEKWSDEGVNYYAIPGKQLDKLAEEAAECFLTEKCASKMRFT